MLLWQYRQAYERFGCPRAFQEAAIFLHPVVAAARVKGIAPAIKNTCSRLSNNYDIVKCIVGREQQGTL
jgi:hypothetical protein